MREEAERHGSPAPIFEATGFFTATFFPNPQVHAQADATSESVTPQVTPQVVAMLQAASAEAKSRGELQEAAGIKDREYFRKAYLEYLLSSGWLERTIPDKPRSPNQRYQTTEAGLAALRRHAEKR